MKYAIYQRNIMSNLELRVASFFHFLVISQQHIENLAKLEVPLILVHDVIF